MKGIASAGCNDLIIFLTSMLHNKIDLFLQAKKEQYGFFSCDLFHIHIIYLSQRFFVIIFNTRISEFIRNF